ncbi:MAG: hypothetical protein QXD03_02280 [Candidatus Anstonellales archaeon]
MAKSLRRILLETDEGQTKGKQSTMEKVKGWWTGLSGAKKAGVIAVPVALAAGTTGYLIYKKRKKKQQEELGDTIGDITTSPSEGMTV